MALSRDSIRADRPPGWPAWSVSLVIHACLLAAMLTWLQAPSVRGAADSPTREVGIVLKRMTDDGPYFEDERVEDERVDEKDQPHSPEKSPSTSNANNPLLAALPSPTEIPRSDAALPRPPTLGPATRTQNQPNNAGQMTAGGTPSKKIGYQATVSVFGIEGTGTRFVYVFDRSISMAGSPLRAAKGQLIASLDSLDSVHQFQIIFFNHEPQAWDLTGGQGRIAFASDANKRQAEKFVRRVSATGGTFRRTALQLALRLRPDVIFFLTDTDDPMAKSDLHEAIRRARRDTIAINTIEYGSGTAAVGENFLTRLARDTGGRYVYVDTQRLDR